MSDIPDEILREILSRLPVAPLLRFRCVSKSWKRLIEEQQFIKHHLTHSQKTNSNLNIILTIQNCETNLYYADFDLLNKTNTAAFKQLSHPLETPSCGTKISGLCDGLLVLRNDADNDTILWNPSVRRFHEIPFTGIELAVPVTRYYKEFFLGFGYDVVSDDYKLIRIVQFHGKDDEEYNSEVKVYSLKSDSWRRIPDFPYYIRADGVLANGALHWILTGKDRWDTKNLVAAFDLGTEEFRLMPLPKSALPKSAGDDYTWMEMLVLGGCLSLMCYVDKDHVDIWAMKEYGVQESWSILFRVDIGDFEIMMPLAYSKCGSKVLLHLGRRVLMWYDLDKRSTDVPMVQMPLLENSHFAYTCLQSLVLLNNGTCDFDLATKKRLERYGFN